MDVCTIKIAPLIPRCDLEFGLFYKEIFARTEMIYEEMHSDYSLAVRKNHTQRILRIKSNLDGYRSLT